MFNNAFNIIVKKKKMKKVVSLIFAAALVFSSANAQILSEQNVTINMDLQPVLQLSMEGADVIDFGFTDVNDYLGGIVKNGATILKVSASMSFDLWAVGYSSGRDGNFSMDQVARYGGGGGANAVADVPVTALELHQYPANPAAGTVCDAGAYSIVRGTSDYSGPFFNDTTGGMGAAAANGTRSQNTIYPVNAGASIYLSPRSVGDAAGTGDKYIAGYRGTGVGCQVVGGSWLTTNYNANATQQNSAAAADGTFSPTGEDVGYYFVIDYRILPGLPANFPFSNPRMMTNGLSPNNVLVAADGDLAGAALIHGSAGTAFNNDGSVFAQPGSYRMFVKYILAEDQ